MFTFKFTVEPFVLPSDHHFKLKAVMECGGKKHIASRVIGQHELLNNSVLDIILSDLNKGLKKAIAEENLRELLGDTNKP